MYVSFQCPSCLKNLEYRDGDTPFQTCRHCKGKVIVPSTVVHQVEIEAEKPGEFDLQRQKELKLAEIQNELNAGRKIAAIKLFKETFRTDLSTAKEAVERLEANRNVEISNDNLRENYSAMQENTSPRTSNNLAKKGQSTNIGQLVSTLVWIAIMVAIFFWWMD